MVFATTETDLKLLQCGGCGTWHAIPQTMYDSCRRLGGFWNCPNGCSRGWHTGAEDTEIAKLRQDKVKLQRRLENTQADCEQIELRRRAQKGVATRLKKRAIAGACPCCNRSFKQLARHMKNQHPEFNHATD